MHYGSDSWMVMSLCMGIQSRGNIFNHYSKFFPVFLSGTEYVVGGGGGCMGITDIPEHLSVFLLGKANVVGRGGGGGAGIVLVVCGKICGKFETMSDWKKNLCGSRY